MGSDAEIVTRIEDWAGEKITGTQSIGGGCIANARRVQTESGRLFFLKSGFDNSMFRNEANGLRELAKADAFVSRKCCCRAMIFCCWNLSRKAEEKEDSLKISGGNLPGCTVTRLNSLVFMKTITLGRPRR